MKKKVIKKRNPIAYALFTNSLFKSKVVKDKKKTLKKFNLKKELSYYLSTLYNKMFRQ